MRSAILASLSGLALLPAAMACTSATFGQGTCQYPVATADGNGPPLSRDIVNSLADCFKAKYGPGPYTFDGLTIPDAGGQGNAWAVQMGRYQLGIGNSCGCTETMDANTFNDLADNADGHLTVKVICGQGDQCPQVTGADGTKLPAQVYSFAYSCPFDDCRSEQGGYNRYEMC